MNVKVAIVDHVGLKAGMDLYDLALYKSLRQLGCESFIYSNFDSAEKGIFKRFRFRVSENLFSFFLMTFKYRKISHDISRRGISHCIVHGFRFGLPEWLLVNILKRSSIKIYMIVHDPESLLETGKSSKWKKKIFELCEAIIVHNAFSADELSKEFNDPARTLY